MKFLKKIIQNFILRFDMFAAQPTLRFNGQSSYETIFGGCLSFLLVIGFVAIFSTSFIDVLQKVNVSATLNLQDNPYDDSEINDIKFAVGIDGLNFSDSKRYFNLILTIKNSPLQGTPTQQLIPLSPCQYSDWQGLGQHFDKLFSVYGMDSMLCPSFNQNLTLKGFAGSPEWVTMNILVELCMNITGVQWTCHSPEQIISKFITQQHLKDFFKVNFLVLNTVISPQQQTPTKSVIQNQIFITFSNTSGSRCQIKLGRYEITTDNSIWPISSDQTEKGYYITSHNTYSINLYSSHYVRIQIEKARTIYQIERSHQKLDEMLSYVGGLFALLFGWLFFFLGSYNEYKYEIAVAQHTFTMDSSGKKIKEDDFGFITFLKYALFDWLKTFGICISWKRMQQIDQARQEAAQQMDVKYLMKRIQRYQIINKLLMGQHNLICANLSRPPTLQQVKRIRKITQYYDKVFKYQNQQKPVANTFNIQKTLKSKHNMDQSIPVVVINQNKQQLQLDFQDEQIQIQIAQVYKEQMLKLAQNQLTAKIINQIPQTIKDRLANIRISQNSQNIIMKQKVKIQSNFSIGDIAPKYFIPSRAERSGREKS